MNILDPKYICGECAGLHDHFSDAQDCCMPSIETVYCCPLCLHQHSKEKEAIECCDFDPDGPPPPPSKKELEMAGQMRLPI